MTSNPANNMRILGAMGADALLLRFRNEVRADAQRQGIKLSARDLYKRAELRRNNHLSKIAFDRQRNDRG